MNKGQPSYQTIIPFFGFSNQFLFLNVILQKNTCCCNYLFVNYYIWNISVTHFFFFWCFISFFIVVAIKINLVNLQNKILFKLQ
jgi:hypothetical protein